MKSNEFVSYLKGAIELGRLESLERSDIQILTQKLETVPVDTSVAGSFCTWLKGFLDAKDHQHLTQEDFHKVVVKINQINSENTQTVKTDSQPVMRC